MNKKFAFAVFLVGIILVSAFAAAPYFFPNPESTKTADKTFYVGVEFGYGNATDCNHLVDKVKNYTNLLVISSPQITQNEALLNQTCDYAYNAGMHIIIYFTQYTGFSQSGSNSQTYLWAMKAKDKYGDNFLGCYVYDEPGGEVLDSATGRLSINNVNNGQGSGSSSLSVDYKTAASNFVANARDQVDSYRYCASVAGTSVMTADYGLFWFDYKAGYDTVLAEFGWENNRQMVIALCRGAATAQGKDWGAIICWESNRVSMRGKMENGTALYNDLTLAYDNGAKYAIIFDYAGKNETSNTDLPNPYEYGILNDEHFAALQNFWNYTQQNPNNHGMIKADTALVLPVGYGFGFRSEDDKIWGLAQADFWTSKIWNDTNSLLTQHAGKLDIVYGDPEFQAAINKNYANVTRWSSGSSGNDYPVVNLNSTFGYDSIQQAVSSGATSSGDTITVKAGTYFENVIVGRPLTLIGAGKENTIIDANSSGPGICIFSPNVTVSGFTVKNGGNSSVSGTSSFLSSYLQMYLGASLLQFSSLDSTYLNQIMASITQPVGDLPSPLFGSGVYLLNAANCTLTDNNVLDSIYGIVISSSGNATLRRNTLTGNNYNLGIIASDQADYVNNVDDSNTVNGKPVLYWVGEDGLTVSSNAGYVALVNCTNITVENLQISGNYNGLLVVNTQHSTISGNALTGNCEALRMVNSPNNQVKDNNISGNIYNLYLDDASAGGFDASNRLNGKPIVIWVDQHERTVPENAGYVVLTNCTGITVQNLALSNNVAGIVLQNTNGSTIVNNTLSNMGSGIQLSASNNNLVSGNTITASQNGIQVQNSSSNTIEGNLVNGIHGNGIVLTFSNGNKVQYNRLTGNAEGVSLASAQNNLVRGNVFEGNSHGLELSVQTSSKQTVHNTIFENNFTKNSYCVYVSSNSLSNTFYHNNFLNNTQQAYTQVSGSSMVNVWDNGSQGNYWSNYSGADLNHDGIGDQSWSVYQQNLQITQIGGLQAYIPLGNDVDRYPLMHPYQTATP
jgi:parallel beta-helix repeat protein